MHERLADVFLIHGDAFRRQVTRHHRWLAVIGDIGYKSPRHAPTTGSPGYAASRVVPGYWSLAGFAKRKVKIRPSLHLRFSSESASPPRPLRKRGLDVGGSAAAIHWAGDQGSRRDDLANLHGDWVDSSHGHRRAGTIRVASNRALGASQPASSAPPGYRHEEKAF